MAQFLLWSAATTTGKIHAYMRFMIYIDKKNYDATFTTQYKNTYNIKGTLGIEGCKA